MSTYENTSQETLLTVPLTDIVAPSLNDVNYASALNNVFENINNNFKTLANHEFVKGDKGKSVEIVEYSFFNSDLVLNESVVDESFKKMNLPEGYRRFFDGTENYYGNLLKKAILSLSNNERDYSDANSYNIFSNFTKDNAGTIQMLVNTDDINDESAPASSLYYVFTDGRYANKNLGNAEESQYTNIKDFSCILVYTSRMKDSDGDYIVDETGKFVDGFEVLNNAFPTIYYEKNVGLCWKLNGIGTGIPVKGAMGKDGKDANIVIVRANAVNESNEIGSGVQTEITEEYKRPLLNVVTGVYENYFGYNSISDYSESALEELNDCTALILTNTQDYLVDENGNYITDAGKDENGKWNDGNYILDPNCNKFYFGKLSYETDKEDSTSTKKKLYAYCNPGTSINSAITTENIINIFKNINIKNESVNASSGLKGLFVPIENTGSDKQKAHLLTATAITDGFETIKSDFLFTPVNDINTVSPTATNEFKVDKYLYIKVPKSHPIFRAENTDSISNFNDFKNGNSNYCLKYKLTSFIQQKSHLTFDETSEYSKNSMYFAIGIDPKNIKYYTFYEDGDENATGGIYKYVDKSIDSMPFSFRSLLSDSTEVSDAKGIYRWELCYDTNEFDIDELRYINYYTVFPECFKSIFTTDLTPSKSSEIMWFNGVNKAGELSGKTVINGWTKNSGFEIIKFTPIYNIDNSKISTDTALNLNYNVNITGDEVDYSRDLNVTGNIHCNDINIHGDIYIDKINKVYTENDIITTKDLHSRNFDVENGRVSCDSINASRNINTANISASEDINASNVKSNIINASEQLCVGNNSITIGENSNTIELNNISNLHIGANTLMQGNPQDTARIDSSLSTLNKNNSSITLFNGSVMDESVFMKGVPRDCEFNGIPQFGGDGVSQNSNVFTASFENAKNFNIHRLSFQSEAKIEDSTTTNIVTKEYNISNFIKSDATYRPALLVKEKTSAVQNSITLNIGEYDIDIFKYFIDCPLNAQDFKTSNNTYNIPDKINIAIDKEFICELSHDSMIDHLSWIKPFSSNSYLKIYGFILAGGNFVNYMNDYEAKHKVYDRELPIVLSRDSEYDYSVGHKGDNTIDYSANLGFKRFYQFAFNIGTITINLTENIRNDIAKILRGNPLNPVSLRFYIGGSFTSDRGEYNSNGAASVYEISLYNARPFEKNYLNGSLSYAQALNNSDFIYNNVMPYQGSIGKLSYDVVTVTGGTTETITESNIKTTTLCNDGIVTRAGKYVFGLGFAENMVNHRVNGYSPVSADDPHWRLSKTDDTAYNQRVPMIFYHKYSPKYYSSSAIGTTFPKNNSQSSKGYAQRTNAISLEELFNVVGFIQSTYLQYGV